MITTIPGGITIYTGHCLKTLPLLAEKSVQCCVTSPPYFNLRDYQTEGQIGLEETPEQYVNALVGVFREVWRVLADDGTLWLNLGDSYAGGGGYAPNAPSNQASALKARGVGQSKGCIAGKTKIVEGIKPKDLIGIPWMVAFALRADGWYLRQDIIWSKPNPMPESVTDRCTKAHEYIFLLSKSARYFYDADAIKEAAITPLDDSRNQRTKENGENAVGTKARGFNTQCGSPTPGMRNKRSVWNVSTLPYDGAHFATFPPRLIEPCILAGSRPGDTILDPFGGSGTTAEVARQLGRKAVLCELNPAYVEIAKERLSAEQLSLMDSMEAA